MTRSRVSRQERTVLVTDTTDQSPPGMPAARRAEPSPVDAVRAVRLDGPGPAVPKAGWAVLVVCCLAQFMVVLDISIVNVALPAMQADLGLSAGGLQWVVNAYTIVFAGLLLFGGRVGDLFGRRRILLFGLALFTATSLVGGLASTETTLILARAGQGVGAAVLAPATLSLLMTSFRDPRERTRALGLWGATAAGGGAFGAFIGGLLTDVASWRWVLFVNVPIGVVLLLAARLVLVESRGQVQRLRDLDLPGTVLVTSGLGVLVYGIVRTESHSWSSWSTPMVLAVAVVLLAGFAWVESRTANPLVPLGIFRQRALTGANVVIACLGASMFGMFYFITLYLQQVEGMNPLRAGIAMLPLPGTIIVGSQVSSRLVGRVGYRPVIVVASLASVVGLGWLSGFSAHGSFWTEVFGPSLFIGFGAGLNMVALTTAATAGVPANLAGLASGLVSTGRQIGAAVGLAVLSTVAAARTSALLAHGTARPDALTAGYSRGLLVAVGVMVAAAALAFVIPRSSGTDRPGTDRADAVVRAVPPRVEAATAELS
jgi:EmrB/QacA subfamily drug resistance transporter